MTPWIFYHLAFLMYLQIDFSRGQPTSKMTGLGLASNGSILEGEVVAICETSWNKVCSINSLTSVIEDREVQNMVCMDYYRFLYTNFDGSYDSIVVTESSFVEVIKLSDNDFECHWESHQCEPIHLRCDVLYPSEPTITFGWSSLQQTDPTASPTPDPTVSPTPDPTPDPTASPTVSPTPSQTASPTAFQTQVTTPELKEGDIVNMTCFVHGGIPQPTITWKANTTSNIHNYGTKWNINRWSSTGVTITFYQTIRVHLTREDNQKIYRCVIEQDNYNNETQKNLNVLFAPIISILRSQTVQESANVTIECTVHSNPVSEVELLNPAGQQIDMTNINEQIPDKNDPHNITYRSNIGAVTPSHMGKYRCQAKNTVGGVVQERIETTTLFVEFAPTISVVDSQTVQESANVNIECTVHSYPISDVKLLNPAGQQIDMQAFNDETHGGLNPYNITYTFNILAVTPSNMGMYRCLAKNTIGDVVQERNKTTMLYIEFAPIISILESQTVQESANVTIECTVHSNPVSEVELLNPAGQQIDMTNINEQIPDKNDPYNITYRSNIGAVTPSDMGMYRCQAKNTVGGVHQERIKTTTLFVEFAPTISVVDSQTVQESANVNIECTVHSYPISDVKLLNPAGQQIDMQAFNDEMPDGLNPYNITYTFNIMEVTPSNMGMYRCLAKNTIGDVVQERNKNTILYVEYAPILHLPSQYRVSEFATTQMTCEAESFPAVEFTWFNGRNEALTHSLYINKRWYINPIMQRVLTILRLRDVQRYQSGNYTCRAENMINNVSHVVNKTTRLYVEAFVNTCKAVPRQKKPCRCNKRRATIKPPQNITNEVLLELMEETKNQLTRDKRSLSSYTSTKVSATDNRPSSVSLGFVGIVVIITAVAFIVSSDVMYLIEKLKMKYFKNNILLMEKGQVDVPRSNEIGEGTAVDDEKPSASCDHNNEFKSDIICPSNDNMTNLSPGQSQVKAGKPTEETETLSSTTTSDREIEPKFNNIGVVTATPEDKSHLNDKVDNDIVSLSNNDDNDGIIDELAVEEKKTKISSSPVSFPVGKDKIKETAFGSEVKAASGKSGAQKSIGRSFDSKVKPLPGKYGAQKATDKLLPNKITSFKGGNAKSSLTTKKTGKGKMSSFATASKTKNINMNELSPSTSASMSTKGKSQKAMASTTSKVLRPMPGLTSKTAKGKPSASTSVASMATIAKPSASTSVSSMANIAKPSTSTSLASKSVQNRQLQ